MKINLPATDNFDTPDNITRYTFSNEFKFIRLFFVLILAGVSISSYAVHKEILKNLVDENRTLTTALELHLTSPDSALINSTVSLNNADAWLFFDNIKPSVVIDKYAFSILIDGEPLNLGVNGRIAIYINGAVVIPFGSTSKPMTIYSEENFNGNSEQLSIETYHNNLGTFDNSIKSFKLKRGYMATLANNADGSGYSRVFIANNQDLEFSMMPEELDSSVSFIRVFKYEWVSKKGKAGWNPNDLNATTYYDWNIGGSSSNDVEYVTIRQNGGWPSWNDINSKQNVTHLLGFNEPDHTDQANMTFQQMIDQWPQFMKSGLRIGSPAWANPWSGNGGNLFDFIEKCDELNYRVDFVALHCYWGGKSPQNWYKDLKDIHDRTGRPLWITEWNNGANWTTEWWPDSRDQLTDANAQKQLNDIKGILQVLDTASFVERYFIYDWVENCRAMVLGDTLTPAGKYYAADTSAIAFNRKNEVIPHWNYLSPVLTYHYLSLTNVIRLGWTDPNGELSRGYQLEKKVNSGEYKIIYNSNDVSAKLFIDSLDPNIGGTVTYRLSLKDINGDYISSNEVSYFQTGGADTIQMGNFAIANLDWNKALFTTRYEITPLIVMGIPTFNNVIPITNRVSNVTTSLFKFKFDPWVYLSSPAVSKSDEIAVLSLPSGSYDFDGLKAEVNAVSDVSRNWVAVNFNEVFATKPVVFCTVSSNNNAYPLTVGIRNVTASGFEMCLKSEETITTGLSGEEINYFAIEPGKGTIEGKRVTAGINAEGGGISATPVVIDYDSTYNEPVVFAGLLSAEDNFASTLRYYSFGDHAFKILKQREMSGGISSVQTDQFGWMIMDMAADQSGKQTGIRTNVALKPLVFYPNPAGKKIYFNFEKPQRVEITDLSGRRVMNLEVMNSLDVSSLNSGIYVLKTEGNKAAKFIKK